MKNYTINKNKYLDRSIAAFYNCDYLGYQKEGNPDFINHLKNMSAVLTEIELVEDFIKVADTAMQDLTIESCPAYDDETLGGINVTDLRDGKSYTVAKFGNYCYMLSNLRLDGGTILNATTSHVTAEYALPVDTGESGWMNDYCKPYMASKNGEYYYNWPAATARINDTVGTSSCNNDTNNSVGDICPVNWILPTYGDITPAALWNNGGNPGMLATYGQFFSGFQYYVGGSGGSWARSRATDTNAWYALFSGTYVGRYNNTTKFIGRSVRCVRSN